MKKILASLLFISAGLWADDFNPLCVKVGGNYSYVHLQPSGLSSFHGNLGGVQASCEYTPTNSIYEGFMVLWRQGITHGGDSLKRFLLDIDTQTRLGYIMTFREKYTLTPFTGFGWRYIGQKLTGGGATSDLNFNEVYIPVGLLAHAIWNKFIIGVNGIWMPQIFPNVNFVPHDNARWVTSCKLSNFQIELPMEYRFNTGTWIWSLELRPFFQYWRDGATLAKSSEGFARSYSKNTYKFGGALLNIGARF